MKFRKTGKTQEDAEQTEESVVIHDPVVSPPQREFSEDNAELLLQTVINSSATALEISIEQISDHLTFIKDAKALAFSTQTTGLSEEKIIQMANHAMVTSARSVDQALEFDIETYFWLSLGLLLLILAMSSISSFASTLFNRTGLALAVGGGIPCAFFLTTMIQQLMDSGNGLKYMTITTLFDTDAILLAESLTGA